jgi:hypothetical protein
MRLSRVNIGESHGEAKNIKLHCSSLPSVSDEPLTFGSLILVAQIDVLCMRLLSSVFSASISSFFFEWLFELFFGGFFAAGVDADNRIKWARAYQGSKKENHSRKAPRSFWS